MYAINMHLPPIYTLETKQQIYQIPTEQPIHIPLQGF